MVIGLPKHSTAAAAGCGGPLTAFSGRSMRVGGATDMAAAGVPPHHIRMLGRWDSDVARMYTRVTRSLALRAAAAAAASASAGDDPSLEELFPGYAEPA